MSGGGAFFSIYMKTRLFIILSVSLIALVGCKKKSIEERFLEEAREYTRKNCPANTAPYTVMDSITFSIPERTFYYNYTVNGALDADSLYTQTLYDLFREQLLTNIRNSIQLKGYKDAGVTLCYRYYSQLSGKLLMTQQFTKEDYE